jgi:hypothetical protein
VVVVNSNRIHPPLLQSLVSAGSSKGTEGASDEGRSNMSNDSAVEDRVDAPAAPEQPKASKPKPFHLDVGRLYYLAIGRTDAQYFDDVKVIGEIQFPKDDDHGDA